MDRELKHPTAVDFFIFGKQATPSSHSVYMGKDNPSDHRPVVLNLYTKRTKRPMRRQRRIQWHLVKSPKVLSHCLNLIRGTSSLRGLDAAVKKILGALPRTTWRVGYPVMLDPNKVLYSETEAWEQFKRLNAVTPPIMPIWLESDRAREAPLVTPRQKARAFNKSFVLKHDAPEALRLNPQRLPSTSDFDVPPITQWEVRIAIQRMKAGTTEDNIGCTARLLKWLDSALVEVLPGVRSN